jgi:hypothetical protein
VGAVTAFSLELPIVVTGADFMSGVFPKQCHATVLGRQGAKISLQCRLVPDQEINIRCHATRRESGARIVGQIGTGPAGTNIIAAARIVYAKESPGSRESVYGVAYVPADQAWTGR